MSGGGDSGGSKKKKADEPAATPTQLQQAFMPGFDTMIAQQLGLGGYGNPSDLLAYMNSIHTPMQIPTNSLPPPAVKDTKSKGGNSGGEYHGGGWQQPKPTNTWRA